MGLVPLGREVIDQAIGEHLTQLMIDYDIGVSKIASYDIKKIDTDYFLD